MKTEEIKQRSNEGAKVEDWRLAGHTVLRRVANGGGRADTRQKLPGVRAGPGKSDHREIWNGKTEPLIFADGR